MTVEELEQLLETVKSTGMKYMMAETSYYRPEMITCREWNKAGKFGTIMYSEAEYHHEGLISIMFDEARFSETGATGLPPMLYPTHSVGMVVPVTGGAPGGGAGRGLGATATRYSAPTSITTLSGIRPASSRPLRAISSRIAVCWHIADGRSRAIRILRRSLVLHHGRALRSPPNTVIFHWRLEQGRFWTAMAIRRAM